MAEPPAHVAAPSRQEAREHVIATGSALMEALRADDLALAENKFAELAQQTGRSPDHEDILLFRVMIALRRGQARDALQYLNTLGENVGAELRVLCLYSMQDPYWEGSARHLAETGSEPVRAAMTAMLAAHARAAAR